MTEYKIMTNPVRGVADDVREAIELNDGYCCCEIKHTPDTHCPCKKFREYQGTTMCNCGRFIKLKEFRTITLCGSTRFKDEFIKAQKDLTLAGWAVETVGLFGHSGDSEAEDAKALLDDMHKYKIYKSDAIFVINVGGYIGESTAEEIQWARDLNKEVYSLEPLKGE
jgi:hypothetical protein